MLKNESVTLLKSNVGSAEGWVVLHDKLSFVKLGSFTLRIVHLKDTKDEFHKLAS